MSNLSELAARVEALEGPCREVDALIVTTLCPGATVSEYVKGEGDDIVFHAEALGIRNKDCCPWYTHSLDAAMTLAGYQNGRPHNVVIASAYGSVHICPNDGPSYGINDPLCGKARAIGDDEIGRVARGVTAAALRARAAQ